MSAFAIAARLRTCIGLLGLAFWLLVAGVSLHPAHAAAVSLAPDMPARPLTDSFGYVEDASRSLTLDDIRAMPAARFSTSRAERDSIGFTASSWWLRTTLSNPETVPVDWVVYLRASWTDNVEYWVVVDGKIVSHAVGGDRTALGDRQVPYRYPAIRHVSAPGEHAELYVHISNTRTSYVALWFELASGGQFLRAVNLDQLRSGLLYCVPLLLAIMAGVGGVIMRDRRFWFYSVYAIAILGTWMGLAGHLGEYVFIDMPDLANDMGHVFMLLAIVASSLFSRDFLRTREVVPWGDRYLLALVAIGLAGIALRMLDASGSIIKLAVVLQWLDVITPAIGWIAMRRGVIYARWYVLAQLFYCTVFVVGGLVWSLTSISYASVVFAQCAFFGQLLFLSVAQYDRMRLMQRERNLMKRDYQKNLELQVAERTRDLETARRLADQANLSKSEFLANVSHEIRTPINAIAGFTTLAMRTDLTPKQTDYLGKISNATRSLSSIVGDLLDFSKIEAGKLNLEQIRFNFHQVVNTVTSYIAPLAEAKGLQLHVDIAPDVPAQLFGDPLRLEQVLLNLCGNAVKFTERGEVTLTVRVQANAPRLRLLFSVRDTGIGLSAVQSSRLFQAFSQGDTSTTRKFGGTGLGLVISKRLVSMMNGQIWHESEVGVGTSFYFEIELDSAPPGTPEMEVANAGKSTGKPAVPQLAGVRILVAEDNPINQELSRELLEMEGATVHIVENGRLAVEAIERNGAHSYDAALIDLQMPEMDGYEATQRIRRLPGGKALPLIAMTAHAMIEERERCLAAGMNDHLSKPVDLAQMIATLHHWIGQDKLAKRMPLPLQAVTLAHSAAVPTESVAELLVRVTHAFARVDANLTAMNLGREKPMPAVLEEPAGDLPPESAPLLAELRECLASNDTYAEEIVARLIASSGDRAPGWLAQVNEAIQSLEYELALARLPTLK